MFRRDVQGGKAITIFNLDRLPTAEDLEAVSAVEGVAWAKSVQPT